MLLLASFVPEADNSKPLTEMPKREDSDAWKQKDFSSSAYIAAKWQIKDRLKSPSTADFPGFVWDGASSHVSNNGVIYSIDSYVDSQNSFGAMIRAKYTVRLEKTGPDQIGDWKVLEATVHE